MLAVKNSMKRRPACGPRAAISAGTGALVSVSRMIGSWSESRLMASVYSSYLVNDKGRYHSLISGLGSLLIDRAATPRAAWPRFLFNTQVHRLPNLGRQRKRLHQRRKVKYERPHRLFQRRPSQANNMLHPVETVQTIGTGKGSFRSTNL